MLPHQVIEGLSSSKSAVGTFSYKCVGASKYSKSCLPWRLSSPKIGAMSAAPSPYLV